MMGKPGKLQVEKVWAQQTPSPAQFYTPPQKKNIYWNTYKNMLGQSIVPPPINGGNWFGWLARGRPRSDPIRRYTHTGASNCYSRHYYKSALFLLRLLPAVFQIEPL